MSDERALSEVKAALLERWRQGLAPSLTGPGIPARSGDGPLPLSLTQERLWFLEQLHPGTVAYNLDFCARVGGRLDQGLLATAVADLIRRHETLRTTFRTGAGGAPVQVVGEASPPELEVVDLRDSPAGAGTMGALERVDAAIHQPFDLARGPLARILLCRLRDRDLLAIVVHHLVGDGWSLGVALRDLGALYEARAAGREPALPDLPVQYGDFAAWQRDQARGDAWRADLDYWRERLDGLEPLALPTDRPRPPIFTPRGDWREVRLGRPLSDALRQLAREEDATLFMILLAAWTSLLSKLSGQRDLAVGTNVANRTLPETLGLIGSFANLVVLRADLEGDPSLREVVRRVRAVCLGAFAHQQAPFERVVEELQPERDLSRNVLFQALFVLQPPTADLRFAGLALEPVEATTRTARAEFELHLWDQPDVAGRINFSTDLFEAATAERLVARLMRLLEAMVADPGRRLSEVSLVLPEERPLLEAWSRGPVRTYPPVPVHQLVRQQADRTPGATAVVAGEEQLDYRTLLGRVGRLAHHLRGLGVGAEVPVGVLVERSVEMVVAVLAVLEAGGAYVPLDPRLPDERLGLMVADSGLQVVVTCGELTARPPARDVTAVRLDADADAIAAWPDASPGVPVHPEQLAYVIYTSGSTGRPKGVQIPHRALTNFVRYYLELPGLGAGDTVPGIHSLSFDGSIGELYPPLVAGGALVVVPFEDVADGERLRRHLLARGVTSVLGTPTAWRLLLAAGGLGDRRITALFGGEASTPDLAETIAGAHDAAWHMYGPTEATLWSNAGRMRPDGPLSLGRPVANARTHLVDEDLRPVPVGVAGEIVIGGAGLARGYLGRPDLTAERFVPDPFGPEPGGRLYRTGDLARYRPDGGMEFLGRRDGQVKLRGYRIELGEIEATLTAHPAVGQAVVVLAKAGSPDASLIAYVVTAPGAAPNATALGRHLRARLPEYMVPSAFVFLDELPRTSGGKVDRLRLPAPERERAQLETEYVAPRTQREREIADMAVETLGLERVGVRDDFFELGSQSLLAARLLADLRERYQVELVLQKLFQLPTVEHLASMIDEELARQHLADEDVRLRRIVADLPDEAVDTLLENLLDRETGRGA